MSILERIHSHQDLVALGKKEREILCDELRHFLIEHVSRTGGHVASNLGVVELTVAIETVYDTEKDRLLFDVGHQSYIHKILTGRQADFDNLRQFGGIAGFPKPSESKTDAFVAGHASSAVSIALGMARARTMQDQDYNVVAVLGDGAATGGLAYEGLNDAGVSGEPMVVILNDNNLSIDRNVGGMASHLRQLRTKERYLGMKVKYRSFLLKFPGGRAVYLWSSRLKDKLRRLLIPSTIFESMGFIYLGPVDGHDTEQLISMLKTAKGLGRPVLIHAITQKGRGYKHSEEHPKFFHGIGKFDMDSGLPIKNGGETFSGVFGHTLTALAEENDKICAITAAMPGGTGLLGFKERFPKRLFDVGIAEEHAVSMAGGLAKQGMIPVVALYSTFLQRAYDMILQDVCMLGLHVVFAVDRAGLVGEDGETHHGIFDVGFLRHGPNLTVLCPGSTTELRDMLIWAVNEQNGPVAIRYPRGGDCAYHGSDWNCTGSIPTEGALTVYRRGAKTAIITYGTLLDNAMQAATLLSEEGTEVSVIRLLTVAPLPVKALLQELSEVDHVVILEECLENGGIHHVLADVITHHMNSVRVDSIHLGRDFVTHGSIKELHQHYGIDGASVAAFIREVHHNEN